MPVTLTNAATADTPNATQPTRLIAAVSHSRERGSNSPTVAPTAIMARTPLRSKASDPVASGAQTYRRSAVTACAQTAAPVLRLNNNVPANCTAAEDRSAGEGRSARSVSRSCINAAVLKNHDPTKHRASAVPAPAHDGKPGTVATAKNVEPTANSQHCRRSDTKPPAMPTASPGSARPPRTSTAPRHLGWRGAPRRPCRPAPRRRVRPCGPEAATPT